MLGALDGMLYVIGYLFVADGFGAPAVLGMRGAALGATGIAAAFGAAAAAAAAGAAATPSAAMPAAHSVSTCICSAS